MDTNCADMMTRQTRNITVAIRAFTIGNYEQRTRASSKSYAQLATACTTVRSKGYCIVVELLAIDGKQGLRRLNLALAHAQESKVRAAFPGAGVMIWPSLVRRSPGTARRRVRLT